MANLTPEQVEANRDAVKDPNIEHVKFEEGFMRGTTKIKDITIRKPLAHALRGLSLGDILAGDVTSIIKLTPRIAEPPMTEADVGSLEPIDILKLNNKIMGFFADAEKKSQIESMT